MKSSQGMLNQLYTLSARNDQKMENIAFAATLFIPNQQVSFIQGKQLLFF